MNFHVGDAISPSTMLAAGRDVGGARREEGENGRPVRLSRPRLLALAGVGGMEFCI